MLKSSICAFLILLLLQCDEQDNKCNFKQILATLCGESAIQSIQACRRNEGLISKQVQVGQKWKYLSGMNLLLLYNPFKIKACQF